MNLILLEPAEVGADGAASFAGSRARHIRDVLRASSGDVLRVGLIDGPQGRGTILNVDVDRVTLRCDFEDMLPPVPPVDLLLALPRPKVLRRLWPQIAAIGVGRVMLTNAEKVERDYFDAHVVHEETWRPLLIEGLQQARDTRLPRVTVHKRFKVLIEDELDGLCPDCRRLVGVPAPECVIARADEPRPSRTLLAVGPEGGWNTFELELLRSRGFEDISLGRRTLRTDTATIGLLTLLHRETLRG